MSGKRNIVCSVCKRHYATQAALTQHRAASHPVSAKPAVARSKPRRKTGRAVQANGLRKNRSFGRDLLGQFSIRPETAAGKVLAHTALCPLALSTGRFGEESALWTRWRPIKLTARIECAGASTTYGSIILGWTADSTPDFGSNSGLQVMRRVATFKPQVTVRLNGSGTINVPCETSRRWLQTTGDVDQSAQGDIAVVVSAQTGGYTGAVTMTMFLDWEVEFEGPTLGISTGPGDQTIGPDAGWSNLFTTSDGSFDSTRLTMKMHHGGSMCPFSAAQPGQVYSPATGTSVPYVREDSQQARVSYFALVQGYSIPGLLCFATYDDARAYITSGDITKALKYTAAGGEITPAVPRFRPVSAVEVPIAETSLEKRVDRLTELVEMLLTGQMATHTAVRDAPVQRRLNVLEETIKQVTNPLLVHLDRGELTAPLYTLTEDPVRTLEERIEARRVQARRESECASGSSFDEI